MPAKDVLTLEQVQANLLQLPQWRYGMGALRTALKCESSASALALFSTIGAGPVDLRPGAELRRRGQA